MRRWIPIAIIIAVIAVGAVVLANKNDNNQTANPAPPPAQQTPTSGTNSSSSQSTTGTSKVSISSFAFSPADITIKKGTTVTWTNNDSVPHQPVADSGTGPASQPLSNGQSYSFKYDSAGTFAYHCAIHPDMHGTVTVTE